MFIYVIEVIEEFDGNIETQIFLFDTQEKAQEHKQKIIDDFSHFIEDIRENIKEGFEDCEIIDNPFYFYCYNALNFDRLTVAITKNQIL